METMTGVVMTKPMSMMAAGVTSAAEIVTSTATEPASTAVASWSARQEEP
jgi:hypothetical protein